MKKAFVFFADGFEIIEALTPVDVMRRAGIDVKTVSITGFKSVISSHKITVEADLLLEEVDFNEGDMVIVPGGYPGYKNLQESQKVKDVVKNYFMAGKFVGAICGGPKVLGDVGILNHVKFTCHSAVLAELPKENYQKSPVIISGNIITSSGAGNSLPFSLALISVLVSEDIVASVKKGMELD